MSKKVLTPDQKALQNPKNIEIAKAIRLIDGVFAKHKMDILLAYQASEDDPDLEVSLTALVCTKKNSDHKPGTVEFNIGAGLPGVRGDTLDFFDLDEALKMYNNLCNKGWGWYRKQCQRRAKRYEQTG